MMGKGSRLETTQTLIRRTGSRRLLKSQQSPARCARQYGPPRIIHYFDSGWWPLLLVQAPVPKKVAQVANLFGECPDLERARHPVVS
jgi:hypothetical protein